ncbi:MAG: LytTR family DNA-binding domain-containing protein [Bacteroidota bacterium]
MIQCVIIDDEPLAIKVLEKYILADATLQLTASFKDALQALDFLQNNQIDLLFLDINMPNLDGLQFLSLIENPPLVIFTTAYAEYAVKSYEFAAIDYLLKPFGLPRFLKAIQKAKQQLSLGTGGESTFFTVRADRKIYRVPFKDTLFLEAYGDYVKIHTTKDLLVPKSKLSALQELLPAPPFLKTHRAYIVNTDKIDFLEGNQLAIGTHKIPISKSLRETVLQFLNM